MSSRPTVLECRGLSKSYGAVAAIRAVDLEIRGGEVTALVGDNGAGKSTLVKLLSGAVQPDSGEILMNGSPTGFRTPEDARRLGIETVWQELALALALDVASNIFLGRELVVGRPKLFGLLQRGRMAEGAKRQLQDLEIDLPAISGSPIIRLSGGQRQAVAVARAAAWATSALFMDEPTAALGVRQSAAVLRLARRVAQRGVAVLVITHTIPHVLEYADRIVVLRHGRKIADMPQHDASHDRIVSLIVGGL